MGGIMKQMESQNRWLTPKASSILLFIFFGLNLLWLSSCGTHDSDTHSSLNQTATTPIDIQVDAQPNGDASPELGRMIQNQILTAFNFIPNAPFRLKAVLASPTNVQLKSMDLIQTSSVSKDFKNGLEVKTAPGSGSLKVDYNLEQVDYDVTLMFEDQAQNLYPFTTRMTVNQSSTVFIQGTLSIDILKVLPAGLQHVLTVFFEDVFTASGSTENRLTWNQKVSHDMLPVIDGEITKFQIEVIERILTPLCNRISNNNGLGLDCNLPKLKTTEVQDAFQRKILDLSATVKNENGDATKIDLEGNKSVNPHIVLGCEPQRSLGSLFTARYKYNLYVHVEDPGEISALNASNLNAYARIDGDWDLVDWTYNKSVIEAQTLVAPELCGLESGNCKSFEIAVNRLQKLEFDVTCADIASGGITWGLAE